MLPPLEDGMVPVTTCPCESVSVTDMLATDVPKFQNPVACAPVCPPAVAAATGKATFWK
jgi:hypothetical protein